MRVGIDITPVIYQGTGIGTYTQELVRHLLPLSKKIHFTLFASTLRGRKNIWDFIKGLSVYDNFNVKLYPLPPLITELTWNKFHRISVEKLVGAVDVFHAWDWQQPPAKNAKLVTTIHDLTTIKFPQEQHAKTVAVHRRRLKWVKQEADAIIADSEATKQDVVDLLGISKNKIHKVYLAASEQFTEFMSQKPKIVSEEIDKVRRKYNLKGDYVLSVGTREPRKNLKRTIKAFESLNNPHLSLVIAGKSGWGPKSTTDNLPARLDSAKRTGEAGPRSIIKVLGFVEKQDLPPLYAGAKVFVYPSLYEGFGLPILEAMSVGSPVVTSDRGSLREVTGDAAVIVDPKNTESITHGIKTALKEGTELTKKGLKQAKNFTWATTARQTLKIYKLVTKR